jgi:hypothetical protein
MFLGTLPQGWGHWMVRNRFPVSPHEKIRCIDKWTKLNIHLTILMDYIDFLLSSTEFPMQCLVASKFQA